MLNPIALHAANPRPITGAGNWTWLLPGRVPTLIDAGTGEPAHLDALAAALDDSTLAQVLVTHGHTDHASGAPALAARHPHATFRKLPWPERDGKWPVVWNPLRDDEEIAAGDVTLTAIHTPGHAPDHLCFWHEKSRSVFCGDLAIQGTTVWIPVSLQGDLAAYLASLERVVALNPSQLYPAHGPVIDEPVALLRQYLDHRREREAQVIEALRAGDSDPGAIVDRVYAGLRPSAVPLARESVLAHLLKLQREGRAVATGERWQLA